jgi:hypothetical protein
MAFLSKAPQTFHRSIMSALLLLQTAERAAVSLWGVVIPATIFVISFVVTWYLYRHFAKQVGDGK